ncbi:MAG: insulinase family protein [Novosphingobium sp.]|nr:insulinase family protein [Novosphingobium sp.]
MHLKSRAARLSALVISVLSLVVAPALEAASAPVRRPAPAKPAAPRVDPNTPWLYRGSDIPQDKEWIFGELSNGVRYAVRKNGVPPGQVSIRVRMDVGSLYEQPSEMGYSHLLEHLVFRQSKYLGDGQAISTFQRLGATFGSDTNALTGPISTTFKLDLPDVSGAKVDEAMKLLSGMVIAPTLSEANVRSDVPIVLAEKRERGGTAERVFEQTQQTLYAGQKLGSRPVIGTEAALTGANQASVRAFHQRWYRPENCVIVAVGDIDPAKLEALIKTWFGDWRGVGPRMPEPPFGDPLAPKGAKGLAPVGETRVIVESTLPRQITYAVLRPWRPVRDTVVYNQGIMIESLAQAIINRRLEARARAGGSFLVAQVDKQKISRSADVTYVSITPLGPDWKTALGDTRAVIADALAKPPTQEEIDREVKEFAVAFESSVEQRRLLPGARLADDMVTALDIRETIASPETVLDIFKRSIPLFTPANVLARTRAIFRGTVTRSVYVTPQANEASPQALKLALAAPIAADGKSRVDAKPIDFASLPPIGSAQQPSARKNTGLLDIEQLDFANGVKVLLWPTEDEPGRVTLKVRFGAGWRAFNPQTAPYAALGDLALVSSGEGKLGQEEIDKIMTGRKMGFDFKIEESTFVFAADTRSADLADQLYLFAAKFATPRWDPQPVLRAKAASKLSYAAFAASPQGMLERDLRYFERNRDATFRTPDPQEIEATTPEGFRQVWEPILRQGPMEIHLFGDFDRDAAVAALAKTFGALPARGGLPAGTAPATARTLAPSLEPVLLHHNGDKDQAAAIIGWPTSGGAANIRESRQLEILTQLLQNRVLEKLREKLGQAYSPQAVNDWPVDLDNGGKIMVIAQLKPEAVPVFFQLADEIAADLVARPVSADELGLVTEPLKQQLTRAGTSSAFIMYLMEGATTDPVRFTTVRSVMNDYTVTTPEAMQALAKKYLTRNASWRLAVLPQGRTLASLPGWVPGAVLTK